MVHRHKPCPKGSPSFKVFHESKESVALGLPLIVWPRRRLRMPYVLMKASFDFLHPREAGSRNCFVATPERKHIAIDEGEVPAN